MGELQEFIRVARHRILIIGLLTMIGFGAAALWVFRSPAEYVATTRLFISGATATSQYDAQQGGVYAQERVVSYEKLVNSRALAQRTIDALHLDMDAGTLATRVTSTSFPDAAVMDVSVTADSPKTARDITNGLANQFIQLASDLETPPDGAAPVVRLTVVDQAEDGTAARILPAKLMYIFGGLVGLIAGLIIAFVWENCSRRIRDGADVIAATGEPVLADLSASRTEILLNSRAEANEATARLRVSIAAVNGSIPHTLALASVPTSKELARRFTAQAALNLVDALVADKRKAVLLVLDSSPDIKVRITRYARKTRKKTDRLIPVQWGFADDQQGNPSLDREEITQRLDQLKTAYEFVIVVLPPLSRFAYAAAVAPVVDGVVAVGIYHQTRHRDLEEHTAEIHRTGATSIGFAFARRTLVPWASAESATEPTVVSVSPPRGVDAAAAAGRKQSGSHTSGSEHRNSENGDSPTQALDLTLR